MKKLVHIGCVAIIALLASSCKEYLDVKPQGEVIPKTAEEFSALLHTHLDAIDQGTDSYIFGNSIWMLELECFSDNLEASLTKYPDGNTLPLYVGSWLNNSRNAYRGIYSTIRDCNIVIHELEERDSELGKTILATAHAMRGACYFNLMRLFCDPYDPATAERQLGLSLTEEFDMENRPARSSLYQTATFIENDLLEAIRLNRQEAIYRYTADVAKFYLARVYFWTRQWDKAAAIAGEILEAHPLVEGEEYLNMMNSKSSALGNVLMRSSVYATGQSSTSDYDNTRTLQKARPVSKEFADLFAEKENDIRYALSFNAKREATKGVFANLRSAEMCLVMAESYAHLGDNTNALKYLNLLRSKRVTGHTPYTMGNLPDVDTDNKLQQDATGQPFSKLTWAIHCERRKELFLEGDRWFELKRHGRPEFWAAKDGQKYTTMQFMYTAPIPRNDMLLIPGMQQNNGYE